MSTLAEAWAALEQAFVRPTRARLEAIGWELVTHERHCWRAVRQGVEHLEPEMDIAQAMSPSRLVETCEALNAEREAERAQLAAWGLL